MKTLSKSFCFLSLPDRHSAGQTDELGINCDELATSGSTEGSRSGCTEARGECMGGGIDVLIPPPHH
jgi:hypothetical protein